MDMCRPSSLGSLSNVATSPHCSANLRQQALADVGVSHLATAEADRDLHPVALGQNFWALRSFTLKSFTSILGDVRGLP